MHTPDQSSKQGSQHGQIIASLSSIWRITRQNKVNICRPASHILKRKTVALNVIMVMYYNKLLVQVALTSLDAIIYSYI